MTEVRRIVIDALKPYDPTNVELARHVAEQEGVAGVNVMLMETDRDVETVKITVEGADIDYDLVERTVEDLGASVHSVDQVVCGEQMVEESETAQD